MTARGWAARPHADDRLAMQVSVLMTSFEHGRYIASALDGVLAQRGVEFELLVGDDASTDSTRSVIADYARTHPTVIRTFLPERNLGNGGKPIFSELIQRARGQYLAMLDADDYWTAPDKLLRQVAYLDDHPECSMCFHNVMCVYEDEARAAEPYNGPDQPSEVDMTALLDRCVVAACSPVFRRETISPLPPWYFELPCGDWQLYFMAAEHGALRYLPEIMGVYRIHSMGMYRGLPRLLSLEQRAEFYAGVDLPECYEGYRRRKVAQTWVKRALEHNQLGQRAAAARCLGRAVGVSPSLMLKAPGALLGKAKASWIGPR